MLRIFFLLSLLGSIAYASGTQTNRALFVAVDTYPAEAGWTSIHAVNDSALVIPMLASKGFEKESIQLLLNKEATKKAILKGLKRIIDQSEAGDHVYIHFSCHGQQMADDNGDEPDGLDEALIPYDARRRYKKGVYEGENHLRDDELEGILHEIRRKTGRDGNVLVVLDACHSGTADRGTDKDTYVRGTTYIFAPDTYEYTGDRTNKAILPLPQSEDLSPITIISACQPDQVNYEYKDAKTKKYYGSLSYAFCEVARTLNGDILTDDLFKKIRTRMKVLFANKARKQHPYFESSHHGKRIKIAG